MKPSSGISEEKRVLSSGSGSEVTAQLHVKPQKWYRISDKLIGIFFEDISRAADGGLCAQLLHNW